MIFGSVSVKIPLGERKKRDEIVGKQCKRTELKS